jgi:hypothetical protein
MRKIGWTLLAAAGTAPLVFASWNAATRAGDEAPKARTVRVARQTIGSTVRATGVVRPRIGAEVPGVQHLGEESTPSPVGGHGQVADPASRAARVVADADFVDEAHAVCYRPRRRDRTPDSKMARKKRPFTNLWWMRSGPG